jgi:hypothetical protein
MFHTGVYRVPHDIDADLAERAVHAGMGAWVVKPEPVASRRRWEGETVIVAAPGPSLTREVAEQCRGYRTIVVQDAWRLLPWADALYGCDTKWWEHHAGVPDFAGEKWSTTDDGTNDKREAAKAYGLQLIAGKTGEGFSTDPRVLHYGSNSGFQAVNLAIVWGAARIILVGFDMRVVGGKRHFFGDHPKPLNNRADFVSFRRPFERAAKSLPPGVEILNATAGSALTCFPMVSFEDALSNQTGRRPLGVEPAADQPDASQGTSVDRFQRPRFLDRAQPHRRDRRVRSTDAPNGAAPDAPMGSGELSQYALPADQAAAGEDAGRQ